MSSVADLDAKSFSAQDSVLNCPIVQEEVNQAINHLKTKNAGGADSLSPYHLKHSGPLLRTWLCHVFNTIVSLEKIPSSFKFGLITPIYKGKGKDPQFCGSYRGITLSSVLAKTLEFVLLERIIPVLADKNIPQLTQTGFFRREFHVQMQFSPALKPSRSTSERVIQCTRASMTSLQLLTLWSTLCYFIIFIKQALLGRPGT